MKPCGTAYFGWKTLGFLFVGVPVCSYSLVDVEVEVHAASCCTLIEEVSPAGLWLEQLEVWGHPIFFERIGNVYVVR